MPACPLAVPGSLDPVLSRRWCPGAELELVADDTAQLHVTQLHSRGGRLPAPRHWAGCAARRRAAVELSAPGFWQVHPAADVRALDAFPRTHHVECVALLAS